MNIYLSIYLHDMHLYLTLTPKKYTYLHALFALHVHAKSELAAVKLLEQHPVLLLLLLLLLLIRTSVVRREGLLPCCIARVHAYIHAVAAKHRSYPV